MNVLYGQDAWVAEWVRRRAPHAQRGFEKYVAIGIEEKGELVAGCVYNEYRVQSMHVSIASITPRWANRKTLRALFEYPFVQLNVARLTAYTGRSMTSVRKFLERLGFVQEGVLRQGFEDDDCVVYGMLRDECRWIGVGHVQKLTEPAASS